MPRYRKIADAQALRELCQRKKIYLDPNISESNLTLVIDGFEVLQDIHEVSPPIRQFYYSNSASLAMTNPKQLQSIVEILSAYSIIKIEHLGDKSYLVQLFIHTGKFKQLFNIFKQSADNPHDTAAALHATLRHDTFSCKLYAFFKQLAEENLTATSQPKLYQCIVNAVVSRTLSHDNTQLDSVQQAYQIFKQCGISPADNITPYLNIVQRTDSAPYICDAIEKLSKIGIAPETQPTILQAVIRCQTTADTVINASTVADIIAQLHAIEIPPDSTLTQQLLSDPKLLIKTNKAFSLLKQHGASIDRNKDLYTEAARKSITDDEKQLLQDLFLKSPHIKRIIETCEEYTAQGSKPSTKNTIEALQLLRKGHISSSLLDESFDWLRQVDITPQDHPNLFALTIKAAIDDTQDSASTLLLEIRNALKIFFACGLTIKGNEAFYQSLLENNLHLLNLRRSITILESFDITAFTDDKLFRRLLLASNANISPISASAAESLECLGIYCDSKMFEQAITDSDFASGIMDALDCLASLGIRAHQFPKLCAMALHLDGQSADIRAAIEDIPRPIINIDYTVRQSFIDAIRHPRQTIEAKLNPPLPHFLQNLSYAPLAKSRDTRLLEQLIDQVANSNIDHIEMHVDAQGDYMLTIINPKDLTEVASIAFNHLLQAANLGQLRLSEETLTRLQNHLVTLLLRNQRSTLKRQVEQYIDKYPENYPNTTDDAAIDRLCDELVRQVSGDEDRFDNLDDFGIEDTIINFHPMPLENTYLQQLPMASQIACSAYTHDNKYLNINRLMRGEKLSQKTHRAWLLPTTGSANLLVCALSGILVSDAANKLAVLPFYSIGAELLINHLADNTHITQGEGPAVVHAIDTTDHTQLHAAYQSALDLALQQKKITAETYKQLLQDKTSLLECLYPENTWLYRGEFISDELAGRRDANVLKAPHLHSFSQSILTDFHGHQKTQTRIHGLRLPIVNSVEAEVFLPPGSRLLYTPIKTGFLAREIRSPALENGTSYKATLALKTAYRQHLSQAYSDTPSGEQFDPSDAAAAAGNDEDYSEYVTRIDGQSIVRPNHGLAHTYRVMIMIDSVINYFAHHAKDTVFREFCQNIAGSDLAELIKVAAAFSITGRESEIGFSDNPTAYARYKEASKNNLLTFLTQNHQYVFDQEVLLPQEEPNDHRELQKIALPPREKRKLRSHLLEITRNLCNPKFETLKPQYYDLLNPANAADILKRNFMHRILSMAHDLDLLRCFTAKDYVTDIRTYNQYVNPSSQQKQHLNQMIRYNMRLIDAHGDRLVSQINQKNGIYTRHRPYSTPFNHASQSLTQVSNLSETVRKPRITEAYQFGALTPTSAQDPDLDWCDIDDDDMSLESFTSQELRDVNDDDETTSSNNNLAEYESSSDTTEYHEAAEEYASDDDTASRESYSETSDPDDDDDYEIGYSEESKTQDNKVSVKAINAGYSQAHVYKVTGPGQTITIIKKSSLEACINSVLVSRFLRCVLEGQPLVINDLELTYHTPRVGTTTFDGQTAQRQEYLPNLEEDIGDLDIQGIASIDSLHDAAKFGAVYQFLMLGDNMAHNHQYSPDNKTLNIYDFDGSLILGGDALTSNEGIFADRVTQVGHSFNNHFMDILAQRMHVDIYDYLDFETSAIPRLTSETWDDFLSGTKHGLELILQNFSEKDQLHWDEDIKHENPQYTKTIMTLYSQRFAHLNQHIEYLNDVLSGKQTIQGLALGTAIVSTFSEHGNIHLCIETIKRTIADQIHQRIKLAAAMPSEQLPHSSDLFRARRTPKQPPKGASPGSSQKPPRQPRL